jgi:hypothetical protein
MWLAAATPAVAQSPSGPDAAPGASSGGPSPDPAPSKAKAKPAAAKRIVAPAAAETTPRTPVQATPVEPARHATPAPHRAKPARHNHHPAAKKKGKPKHAPAHRTVAHAPALPRLDPVRLVAPTTDPDAGRARKLAAGALSLLILALASAMLLAFTARVERRRVVR